MNAQFYIKAEMLNSGDKKCNWHLPCPPQRCVGGGGEREKQGWVAVCALWEPECPGSDLRPAVHEGDWQVGLDLCTSASWSAGWGSRYYSPGGVLCGFQESIRVNA